MQPPARLPGRLAADDDPVIGPPPRHTVPAKRRQEILAAVRSGAAHVADLAESFGVSEMTVRRDLQALAREGKLERVRGGAVDRKSTRLNSSHANISYAVFCLKKKK